MKLIGLDWTEPILPILHEHIPGNGCDLWVGRCQFCYELIPEEELDRLLKEHGD